MTQGRKLAWSPTCICFHPGSHSHLYPGNPDAAVQFPFPHATVLHIDPITGARSGLRGEKKSSATAALVATVDATISSSTTAAPPPPANRVLAASISISLDSWIPSWTLSATSSSRLSRFSGCVCVSERLFRGSLKARREMAVSCW